MRNELLSFAASIEMLEWSKQSPDQLPRPSWLNEGDYYGPYWIVIDDNPDSPKNPEKIRFDVQIFDPRRPGELCRLTDKEYTPLLIIVRRVLFNLRTGRYARVTSASFHEDIARRLIDLVQWMILNGITRFSNLCRDDFDAYVESVTFGPDQLLKYKTRLEEHYGRLKTAGGHVPVLKSKWNSVRLDTYQLLSDAGIDPLIGIHDQFVRFELLKIAKAKGCYLLPRQAATLSAGPPELERRSERQVAFGLLPWFYLWLMRRDFDDQINFDPFENVSIKELTAALCKEGGRTKTPPIRQVMELINFSLRWVLLYAPVLLELRDQYYKLSNSGLSGKPKTARMSEIITQTAIPEGPACPSPLSASSKSQQSGRLSFGTAVQAFIPCACLVVIAAFTGRRHDEVLSIRAAGPDNDDCISEDESGLWIETYIEKSVQDWVRTPCNDVVKAAVEILRIWSEPARRRTESVNLFQYESLISHKVAALRTQRVLGQFLEFLPITPMPDGCRWPFTLHQLRRFFAILYFWHYQYGELASLSYHFRHLDPRVTQLYVTEPDSGKIFRQVSKEFTTTLLTEAAMGERNISGPFGERFKAVVRRLLDHYRKTVRVVSPELVEKTVNRYVEKSGRRLKAFLWGFCACGTSKGQLRIAKCLEGEPNESRVAPDFARSGFSTCGSCPHHATELFFKRAWEREIEDTQLAATDPNNPLILRKASDERGSELRYVYERSFERSKSLEALNEVPRRRNS